MTDVVDKLARYHRLTLAVIERRLPSAGSAPYLAELMADYPRRSAKGLRPALCLAACEAFGGSANDALPTAVALELLHNAFLVHDDIEDDSEIRRGRPTMHRSVGTPLAINTGDGLALAGVGVLADNHDHLGPGLAADIYREFDFMARQTVEGQALDIGWRMDNRLDLTPDDYLELIMKKTCWYTTVLPLRVGAMIGTGGRADLAPMIEFGFHLGVAFQIRDDILNLTGDETQYGKELLGDLRESKRSLILIHLLAVLTGGDLTWAEEFLAPTTTRTPEGCKRMLELMEVNGSIGFASEFASGIADAANDTFETAFSEAKSGPARSFIKDLIPYMVERGR